MNKLLEKASKAYYKGEPIMSDEEFDNLSKNNEKVGYEVTDDNKRPHYNKLYSLKTIFNADDIKLPLPVVTSPKLDGAAVSILYYNGIITISLTRGDGIVGTIVTEKIKYLVPNRISIKGTIQITGEVVASKEIKNSRNYAAGALNLKSVEEFKNRDLTFIAYAVYPAMEDDWSIDMHLLGEEKFNTVLQSNWEQFPQDGIVFRTDNYKVFKDLGYTSHHPRGAIALKKQAKGVETVLLDVIWQVGKSGIVSPVAILEPIDIGGALVSKATLHNISYIEELKLEIGCKVEVIRSGEVIPRIIRKVVE